MSENNHNFFDKSCKKSSKDYICGIYCDVENCAFHAPDSKCCADHIKVSPNYASDSSDTACATFQQK